MHQTSSAISISYLDSWCPSRSQKMQPLNFLWEVVIMPCLLAEGISGLVQRISDSTLISFSFLQVCVVHVIYLHHSFVCVHVKRTLVSIETWNFLALKGLICTPLPIFISLWVATKWQDGSSKGTHHSFLCGRCCICFQGVKGGTRVLVSYTVNISCSKKFWSVINALPFRYHICLMHLFKLCSIGYLKDSLFNT